VLNNHSLAEDERGIDKTGFLVKYRPKIKEQYLSRLCAVCWLPWILPHKISVSASTAMQALQPLQEG
jgi:hypothetical protein